MAENIPKVLTSQDCLVTLMMAISASDGRILTAELVKIQSAVNHLPIFADYDVDRFTLMSQVVFNLFEKEDGLECFLASFVKTYRIDYLKPPMLYVAMWRRPMASFVSLNCGFWKRCDMS